MFRARLDVRLRSGAPVAGFLARPGCLAARPTPSAIMAACGGSFTSTWTPSTPASRCAISPALRGQAVAVAHQSKRGVVLTASYEARAYGVRSAMPTSLALQQCPHLRLIPPRMDVYKQVSDVIRAVFLRYTDLVEPLSLDEAYLDVSQHPSGTRVAQAIKADIRRETRSQRLRRGQLQQVSGQARLRHAQAGRPDSHPPRGGRSPDRGAAGGSLPRRRPGHARSGCTTTSSSPGPTSSVSRWLT